MTNDDADNEQMQNHRQQKGFQEIEQPLAPPDRVTPDLSIKRDRNDDEPYLDHGKFAE